MPESGKICFKEFKERNVSLTAFQLTGALIAHYKEKGWFVPAPQNMGTHYIVMPHSNLENSVVNFAVYFTRTVVVHSKNGQLAAEAEQLLVQMLNNPGDYFDVPVRILNRAFQRYTIKDVAVQDKILEKVRPAFMKEERKPADFYRAMLKLASDDTSDQHNLTLSCYTNGTVTLDGCNTEFFYYIKSMIEYIGSVDPRERMAGFVSTSQEEFEKNYQAFQTTFVDYEQKAKSVEGRIRTRLQDIWHLLRDPRRTDLTDAGLLLANRVFVKEYSSIIMPASRAMEGFFKDCFIRVGLIGEDDFLTFNSKGEIRSKGVSCGEQLQKLEQDMPGITKLFFKTGQLNKEYRNRYMHAEKDLNKLPKWDDAVSLFNEMLDKLNEAGKEFAAYV